MAYIGPLRKHSKMEGMIAEFFFKLCVEGGGGRWDLIRKAWKEGDES